MDGVTVLNSYMAIRYEVTISNEVTLKEFQERYKIVNQRGNIYVVEERADANE